MSDNSLSVEVVEMNLLKVYRKLLIVIPALIIAPSLLLGIDWHVFLSPLQMYLWYKGNMLRDKIAIPTHLSSFAIILSSSVQMSIL